MKPVDGKLSPVDFLEAIFPPDLRRADEAVLVSWPATFLDGQGRRVDYYRQRAWQPRALRMFPDGAGWLYCVSTVRRQKPLRRRLVDVLSAWVLVCDDVGSKASEPPVEASYVLETSLGNYQWGYLLDPFDVSCAAGAGHYDACLLGLARAGYNDFGCRSASRVIKLPGATHVSGFVTGCVEWSPERVWTLEGLMAEMAVEPAYSSAGARRPVGRHTVLGDVNDPIYTWLVNGGLVTKVHDDWVDVICPWAALHSAGGSVLAGYSPLDYGSAGRSFHCFHGHGVLDGLQQFLSWVERQGGPSLDNSYQRLRILSCIN